jgi:hypothetical protein
MKRTLVGLSVFSLHCGGPAAELCFSVGPPCGLTVDFEDGDLDIGTYTVAIDTDAGRTTCDYVVEAPNHQTRDEAEAADQALADCEADGSCPADERCTGPDTVHLRSGSLTIEGASEVITVSIEDVATGARSEKDFTPSYTEHAEDCADCVVASDSMPLP